MSEATATEPPADPFQLLPTAVYRSIIAALYAQLPSPTLTDPELIAERVHAAIAEIASMVPVNAEEARIAARVVIADAQAADCIRHARTVFNSPGTAMQCHAQANHYMRTANAARALLLRVQTARHKREAIAAACSQDAWTIHATEGLLLAAAGHATAAPPPRPEPEPPPPDEDNDKFARYDEAEQYAIMHPQRAAEIRAHGGLPPPPATSSRPRPCNSCSPARARCCDGSIRTTPAPPQRDPATQGSTRRTPRTRSSTETGDARSARSAFHCFLSGPQWFSVLSVGNLAFLSARPAISPKGQ